MAILILGGAATAHAGGLGLYEIGTPDLDTTRGPLAGTLEGGHETNLATFFNLTVIRRF